MATEVRKRRKGYTRVSAKHQVTIPVDVMREAGLEAGDEVRVAVDDSGRVVLERAEDVLARSAGMFTGMYPPGYLDALRDEWDRSNPIADLDALDQAR